MGTAIDQVAPIDIKFGSPQQSTVSFTIPMLVAPFLISKTTAPFTQRTRSYDSTVSMKADGWLASDPVYKAAEALFASTPSPSKIIVGRRQIASDPSPDATWAATLDAVLAEDDSAYFVNIIPVGATEALMLAEIKEVSDYFEVTNPGLPKFFVAQQIDVGILSAGTTDIAYVLKNDATPRVRTLLLARPSSLVGEYADAAWVGEMAPHDVGSSQWAYKTLVGRTPATYTVAQKLAVWAKNCNTYTKINSIGVTEKGITPSGERGHIRMGLDWIKARLQEAIFQLQLDNRIIPLDDDGILLVVSTVKGVLAKAASAGIIDGGSVIVTAPAYKDLTTAQKQAGTLPNVNFYAKVLNGISTVAVNGTVGY